MFRNRNVGHEQVVKMLENGANAKAKSREGRASSSLAKKRLHRNSRTAKEVWSKGINGHKYGFILCPQSLLPSYNHLCLYLSIFKEAHSISALISII